MVSTKNHWLRVKDDAHRTESFLCLHRARSEGLCRPKACRSSTKSLTRGTLSMTWDKSEEHSLECDRICGKVSRKRRRSRDPCLLFPPDSGKIGSHSWESGSRA